MPGVIGASILPPRPARGYRFHSLQVEIIVGSLSASKPQSFSSNFQSGRAYLCCNPNNLLQKKFRKSTHDHDIPVTPGGHPTMRNNPPQLVRWRPRGGYGWRCYHEIATDFSISSRLRESA